MGSQFPPQRGDDAIIISPQIPDKQLEFKEPISKKPRNVEDLSSNPSYPKRPNSLFYKTRLCLKFEFRGSCVNGNSCNFAHGSEDLRRPPPNWQELVGKDSNPSEEQVFVKNRICKKFYRGEVCSYGDRCIFMHVEPRLLNETSSAIERGDDNGNLGQHKSESIVVVGSGIACNQKGNYWKTKICNKWEATGHCAFGDKCHFAHGPAELMEFRNHFEFDRVKHAAVVAATPHHSQSIQDVNSWRTTTTALSMSSNANMPQTRTRSRTRGLLNWERLQNIYHIYADCIDGLPPHISGPEQ